MYGNYYYGIDYTYLILVLPAFLFTLWAQYKVKSTYNRYSKAYSRRGQSAADIARQILDQNGLYNVGIGTVAGELTDHYDPRTNTVNLSQGAQGSSIAAIGVAAHEVGHAIQHASGYFPLKVRNAIVPVCQIGANLAMPLFLAGLLFNFSFLMSLGIIFFGAAVVFQLITLPVEFNASRRAIATLDERGILDGEELSGAKKVLRAAALTYVGALALALAQLLRLVTLSQRRR